jgi:preprotein translocase subunit SecD
MNRYPLWKYIVIAVALVVGFLYTLPNFFGEVPAVQISPGKSTAKIDEVLRARVEQTLGQANIVADGVFLEANGIKVRFGNTDTNSKPRTFCRMSWAKTTS